MHAANNTYTRYAASGMGQGLGPKCRW